MEFREVVCRLQDAEIDFFVTGGFAVYLYTKSRKYNDIDIVVKASDFEKIEKLFGVERVFDISPFNEEYAAIRVGNFEFCDYDIKDGEENFFFGIDHNYMNYKYVEFEGLKFRLIDPEELVIFKIFHNRKLKGKQDLDDVKLMIKHVELDWMKIIVQSFKHKSFKGLLEIMLDKDLKGLRINTNFNC